MLSPRLSTLVRREYDFRVNPKERLSASVDADLMDAAREAVAAGRSASVSAWVNDALRLKREHDERLVALADFVAAFEAEHGEISAEEMHQAARRARARARTVRSLGPKGRRSAG